MKKEINASLCVLRICLFTLEQTRVRQLQVHEAGWRNAFFSPLGHRWLRYVEHPCHSGSATKPVNFFGIGVYLFHSNILAIVKEKVNSHG